MKSKEWELASVIPEGGRNTDTIATLIKGSYLKMCDDIQEANVESPNLFTITVDKYNWIISIEAITKQKGD